MLRQKGSHVRLSHKDVTRRKITVPLHQEIKIGLLGQILKDAGMTIEIFLNL